MSCEINSQPLVDADKIEERLRAVDVGTIEVKPPEFDDDGRYLLLADRIEMRLRKVD